MKLFLDTNVVIYGLDPRDPERQARCAAWLSQAAQTNSLTICPQVCNETRSVAVRKLKISPREAHRAVLGLLPWCTAPYGAEEIREAVRLVERWRLSWWDGLLIASALAAGCDYFITADAQSAPVIEGLRIVDPMRLDPSELLGAA